MIINKELPTKNDLETLSKNIVKPLKDDFDFSDIIVKKPWGYEYLLFENDDVAVWILHLNPFSQTSMHCHPNKSTSLICLNGQVECKTLDSEYLCDELKGIYLGEKVYHQTSNKNNSTAIIMEIETPVNKFDLVRFEDDYGRKEKKYEAEENYTKKDNLTVKKLSSKIQRSFESTKLEIGFAKSKSEFLEMCKIKDDKMIITLLNRNIWSKLGQKVFNVGQIVVFDDELLEENRINDGFTYLILKRN